MTARVQALVLGLALCAATAGAQTPTSVSLSVRMPSVTPLVQVQQTASVGPVLRSSAVGIQSLHQAVPLDPAGGMAATTRQQSRAMMIVGGAALIVGAIIGGTPGTIVMVGGGVVGLIGLYNYLE